MSCGGEGFRGDGGDDGGGGSTNSTRVGTRWFLLKQHNSTGILPDTSPVAVFPDIRADLWTDIRKDIRTDTPSYIERCEDASKNH